MSAHAFIGWGYRVPPGDTTPERPRTPHRIEHKNSCNAPCRKQIAAALRANPELLQMPRIELVRRLSAEFGVGDLTARRAIAEAQGKPYAGMASTQSVRT